LANSWLKQLEPSPNKEERPHTTFSSILTKQSSLKKGSQLRLLKDTKHIVLQSHHNLQD